jgi:hypothetical protein
MGAPSIAPASADRERALNLLAPLIASGQVIALNLLGSSGEAPDFLVHAESLPRVFSLRGERNWKHAPVASGSGAVSPLAVELWQLLDREGPLTAAQASDRLGREVTEAAASRAFNGLWQSLRVLPVLQTDGRSPLWEVTQRRHRRALAEGSSLSQVTAISVLVSLYLQSVYMATAEEIEVFLSPLVSRSRIREAVRGLSATRQLQSISLESQSCLVLDEEFAKFSALAEPELPGSATAASQASGPESTKQTHPSKPIFDRAAKSSITRTETAPRYDRPAARSQRHGAQAGSTGGWARQGKSQTRPPGSPSGFKDRGANPRRGPGPAFGTRNSPQFRGRSSAQQPGRQAAGMGSRAGNETREGRGGFSNNRPPRFPKRSFSGRGDEKGPWRDKNRDARGPKVRRPEDRRPEVGGSGRPDGSTNRNRYGDNSKGHWQKKSSESRRPRRPEGSGFAAPKRSGDRGPLPAASYNRPSTSTSVRKPAFPSRDHGQDEAKGRWKNRKPKTSGTDRPQSSGFTPQKRSSRPRQGENFGPQGRPRRAAGGPSRTGNSYRQERFYATGTPTSAQGGPPKRTRENTSVKTGKFGKGPNERRRSRDFEFERSVAGKPGASKNMQRDAGRKPSGRSPGSRFSKSPVKGRGGFRSGGSSRRPNSSQEGPNR